MKKYLVVFIAQDEWKGKYIENKEVESKSKKDLIEELIEYDERFIAILNIIDLSE